MKIQSVILVLAIAAFVSAVPNLRERRAAETTTAAPANGHCGDTSHGLVITLLIEVGNLLVNLLANLGKLTIPGVLGSGGLLNLTGLLQQVSDLLNTLLVGGSDDSTDSNNEALLGPLVDQLISAVDNLLGPGTGVNFACHNSGGIVGGLLQGLINAVAGLLTGIGSIDIPLLGPLLKFLLDLVAQLLKALV